MSDFSYNPRTVGIIKKHARTMAPTTIANIMRCPIGTVEVICKKHGIEMREADVVVPPPEKVPGRKKLVEVEIDIAAISIINNAARVRGLTDRELIARLIEQIAEDRLFSAVLDR